MTKYCLQLANHSSVCMACVGDWTKAVHKELSIPSSRPGWVYGPFASPFIAATSYDNIIVVALGIGITPVNINFFLRVAWAFKLCSVQH